MFPCVSSGYISYGPGLTAALYLYDRQIVEYYYSLIPKYYYAQRQKHPPHITIVRLKIEKPTSLFKWGESRSKEFEFNYSPVIQMSDRYFWLQVQCKKIGEIRQGLGLPEYRFSDNCCYHITIANKKRDGK